MIIMLDKLFLGCLSTWAIVLMYQISEEWSMKSKFGDTSKELRNSKVELDNSLFNCSPILTEKKRIYDEQLSKIDVNTKLLKTLEKTVKNCKL